jgi:hypothetical protein
MRCFTAFLAVIVWLASSCGGQVERRAVEEQARPAEATHVDTGVEGEMCMEPPPEEPEPEPCE